MFIFHLLLRLVSFVDVPGSQASYPDHGREKSGAFPIALAERNDATWGVIPRLTLAKP
jgi:hypothetical protein